MRIPILRVNRAEEEYRNPTVNRNSQEYQEMMSRIKFQDQIEAAICGRSRWSIQYHGVRFWSEWLRDHQIFPNIRFDIRDQLYDDMNSDHLNVG